MAGAAQGAGAPPRQKLVRAHPISWKSAGLVPRDRGGSAGGEPPTEFLGVCWGRAVPSQPWLLDFGLVAHLLMQSLMSICVPSLSLPCAFPNCSPRAVKLGASSWIWGWAHHGSSGEQDLWSECHLHLFLPLPRAAFSFVNV